VTHTDTAPEIGVAITDCARDWMAALTGDRPAPGEARGPERSSSSHRHDVDAERWLAGLVARLVTLLRAEPFDAAPAGQVGAALVEAHHTDCARLISTGQVLDRWLPALAGRDDVDARRRLMQLVTALCAGFAEALRQRASSEQHHLHLRLRHQAYHDGLTGLPNRALLAERIHQLFRAAAPDARVGLCFLDLDGFKQVNDRYGHDVGDRLLVAVAERMNGCVTTQGHLLARVGGDEFVILVAMGAEPGAAVAVADQVMRAMARPFRIDACELSVSASIGVVERRVGATAPAELMRAADLTMYRAKVAGKNRWALCDQDRPPLRIEPLPTR
jgi:diguanylate cyclase (GGDEF)-like protein